jgi:hypothetical protein
MCNSVAPAIPDFTWSAATDGAASSGATACCPALHSTAFPAIARLLNPPPANLPACCAESRHSSSADGYAIVSVKVSGHHTGAPFALPGLPPVPASGRRVTLEQQLMKVKVEGGRIREIVVSARLPARPPVAALLLPDAGSCC